MKYEWDCRDDGTFEITGQAVTAVCAYEDDGTYTARLRVTAAVDGVTGGSADATAVVVIANPVYTPPGNQLVLAGTVRNLTWVRRGRRLTRQVARQHRLGRRGEFRL